MLREPQEEWQAEVEATAGYEKRAELLDRWFETDRPEDFETLKHWIKSVTWPAELAVWHKANDWYAAILAGLSPRRRANLPQVAIRCRDRGCLLGRVYRFDLPGSGERVYFVGMTSSGKVKHGVCNWAFADSYDGLQRWWQVGCKHGHVKLGTGELIELIFPARNPDDERIPEEYRLAWRKGVYLPSVERWLPRRTG